MAESVVRHGGIGSTLQRPLHLAATASRVTTPVRITLLRKITGEGGLTHFQKTKSFIEHQESYSSL